MEKPLVKQGPGYKQQDIRENLNSRDMTSKLALKIYAIFRHEYNILIQLVNRGLNVNNTLLMTCQHTDLVVNKS